MQMIKEGIIPMLVKCLTSHKKSLIAQVANTICSLAQNNEKIQTDFRKAGVISPLIMLLAADNSSSSNAVIGNGSSLRMSQSKNNPKNSVRVTCLKAIIALACNKTNLDVISRANNLCTILSTLQSRDEEVLVHGLDAVWKIAEYGTKYRNAIRTADSQNLVSLFVVMPKLMLHYEENVAIRATGAIAALAEKNKKNTALFLANEALEMLHSMPETSNSTLQEQMAKVELNLQQNGINKNDVK